MGNSVDVNVPAGDWYVVFVSNIGYSVPSAGKIEFVGGWNNDVVRIGGITLASYGEAITRSNITTTKNRLIFRYTYGTNNTSPRAIVIRVGG